MKKDLFIRVSLVVVSLLLVLNIVSVVLFSAPTFAAKKCADLGSGLQSCKLEKLEGMMVPWHANHAYITLAPYTTLSCEATPGRTSSSMTKALGARQ